MFMQTFIKDKKMVFMAVGLSMGVAAPLIWSLINILFFPEPGLSAIQQVLADIGRDRYHSLLYGYMGIGTAIVMSTLGYYIGKVGDSVQERTEELDRLHTEVVSQKEGFESRYRILDENIRNFQKISSRIQKSLDIDEVLHLCAEGLHDVLGYERVNILLVDKKTNTLNFFLATGTDNFDINSVSLPLDARIGVIYKCYAERKRYLVDDIAKCSPDYYLQAPYDNIKPLRSRSFVMCPIVVRGETVGIFGIDNKMSKRQSNASDVDTINLFADQAAASMNKINLLKAIGTLTTELESTFSSFLQKREQYTGIVNNLKLSVESVYDGTAQIATSSEGVMSSVDETSSAVSEISVAIDQVTKNLDYLSESVEKSLSAMEEMHASIKNVEQNAAVSHDVSSRVKIQADKGMAGVEETIAALADIQKAVELSYETIKRLSESSGRIGNIVNVIKEITKRTNLLALNASIIAAQAGEYGKNFAVVADEIRNLSHQTSQSTGEITSIVEQILTESQKAAKNVTFSKEMVQNGVVLGQAMGDSLKVILENAIHSMKMTEEIKVATEEQVKGVKLITHSTEDVSSMTAQIFNASKEQSKATKNIVRYVHNIENMAQSMVKATAAQHEDMARIDKSVETYAQMVEEIFSAMEERKQQSQSVIEEMEQMQGAS